MKKFYDRKDAHKKIESLIQQINCGIPTAVWIEGKSGVGKTYLLEYIQDKKPGVDFFRFIANEVFYKCERGSVGSSFEYIAAVIYEIQYQSPKFFENYIQRFFDSIQHISLLDACCLILPQVKAMNTLSALIETKYKNITTMQSKIADRLVTYQLVELFSDLILSFLIKVDKRDKITFCIDDAQWLDQPSMRVLEVLIKKSRQDKKGPVISIFLDIREKSILSDDERQNHTSLFRMISHLYPDLETIYLKNFDLITTQEIIRETNRVYLIQHIPMLYKITNGNPLELSQTLQFSDDRVQEILQRECKQSEDTKRDDTFSIERIGDLYFQNTINTVLLSVLSILRRSISIPLLYQCVENLYSKILQDTCTFNEFNAALNYLEDKECIVRIALSDKISLKHDSIYHTVLEYLSHNGDYVTYSKEIAITLLSNEFDSFLKEQAQKMLALKLLYEVDPQNCLTCFQSIYRQSGEHLEADFFATAAEAFCASYLRQDCENLHFVVQAILPKLVSSANLVVAQRLCHTMFMDYSQCLPVKDQITYLVNYIKAQIDLSVVNDGSESAVPLFNKLYLIPNDNNDLKLQILLLGMSAYEHLLEHDKIRELFVEAEKIIDQDDKSISNTTKAIFYRNKGLCFPHSDLKTDYFYSLRYASKIPDFAERHLMFGTSMNNLGLSYFYSGEIEKARRAFSSSQKHLTYVGYNTARISNNIGVCYYMLHDWPAAHHYFAIAAAGQTDGVFMKLCIQTNLALALYSIGKQKDALAILDPLIDEYNSGKPRSHDTLVYCAAAINRGYIAFQQGEYFDAAKYYKMSLMHTYRYQNEEQLRKRTSMLEISAQRGLGTVSGSERKMDLKDDSSDFYRKPYSLVAFAFYVI